MIKEKFEVLESTTKQSFRIYSSALVLNGFSQANNLAMFYLLNFKTIKEYVDYIKQFDGKVEIIGGFPQPVFKDKEAAKIICDLMNKARKTSPVTKSNLQIKAKVLNEKFQKERGVK